MDEEPVSPKGKKMPRSTMMVMVLGSFALLLCTASALVGGVFLGAVLFQGNGFMTNGESIELAPAAPVAPTAPAPDRMPFITPTPVPFGEGNAVTATPLPMNEIATPTPVPAS
jgi:hypothetical protein